MKVINGGQGDGRFGEIVKPDLILPKGEEMGSQSRKVDDSEIGGRKLSTVENLPVPPATMPVEMHGEWRGLMLHLKERRLLNDAILPVARAFVLAVFMQNKAEESIQKDGVFVAGASGAVKGNPAIGLLRGSQSTIARLARQLGLGDTAKRMPDDDGKQPSLFREFDL